MAGVCRGRARDHGNDLAPEALELVQLVGHRPDEDSLHACLRERGQLLGEQLRRTDREAFAECLLGAVDGRDDPLLEDALGLGAVRRASVTVRVAWAGTSTTKLT